MQQNSIKSTIFNLHFFSTRCGNLSLFLMGNGTEMKDEKINHSAKKWGEHILLTFVENTQKNRHLIFVCFQC